MTIEVEAEILNIDDDDEKESAKAKKKAELKEADKKARNHGRLTRDPVNKALAKLGRKGMASDDVKMAREARLLEAYRIIVSNGESLRSASNSTGIPISTLRYHCQKNKWMEARVRLHDIQQQAESSDDISQRAEALRMLMLERFKKYDQQFVLLEQTVSRKVIEAACTGKIKTLKGPDGTPVTVFVPAATAKELADLVELQGKMFKQAETLLKFTDIRTRRDLERIRRGRKSRKARTNSDLLVVAASSPPVSI